MTPRHKLVMACALLGASMLPLTVEPTWDGVRLNDEPMLFLFTVLTWGLGLWGSFAGRAAWVMVMIRAFVQVLAMLMMLATMRSYERFADFRQLQAGVSLLFTAASIWLLRSRMVGSLVWRLPENVPEAAGRPLSRLGTRGVLGGFMTVALLLGSVEQAWVYQHISLVELALRSLYLVLPWAGAWQLAKLGRDRVWLTTLGALLGELGSELMSLVASGAQVRTVVFNLLLPLANLPVVVVGLALAVFGPRRPLWQLGIALPLAQLLYRAAAVLLTTQGGMLSWQAAVLAVLSGMGCAGAVYLFRRTEEESRPVPLPPREPAA